MNTEYECIVLVAEYWAYRLKGKELTSTLSSLNKINPLSYSMMSILFNSIKNVLDYKNSKVANIDVLADVFHDLRLNEFLCDSSIFVAVMNELLAYNHDENRCIIAYKNIFLLIKNLDDTNLFKFICISNMINKIVINGNYSDIDFILELVEANDKIDVKIFNVPEWFKRLF